MAAKESLGGFSQIWEVSYPEGTARRITNDLNTYTGVGVTSDGSTLVTVQYEGRTDLWIAPGDAAGGQAREFATRTGWNGLSLSWTPDGRVVHAVGVSGSMDIWITGESGGSSQLTIDPAEDYDPVVCEGRYIVFVSSRAGSHNLWRMDLDGGNKVQLTSGVGEFLPRCRPGTGRVIFQRQGPSRLQISAVPIDGGETAPLSPAMDIAWWTMDISPDGRRLAYLVPEEGERHWSIEVMDLSNGKTARPIDLPLDYGIQMSWSPDGLSIQHVVTEKGVENIWSTPLDGGPSRQITRFDSGRIRAFAWHPDGTKLVLARGTVSSDIVLLQGFR